MLGAMRNWVRSSEIDLDISPDIILEDIAF